MRCAKWLMLLWLLLSACGGGGGAAAGAGGDTGGGGTGSGGPRPGGFVMPPPPPPPDPRLARLDGYEAVQIRVLGQAGQLPRGPFPATVNLPSQGAAQFTGFASLRVEAAQVITLFGDASLAVDFASQQVSGKVERVFGTSTSGVADFTGMIAITTGNWRDDLRLSYAADLAAPGHQVTASGTMVGDFLGDPVAGLWAVDLDGQARDNGRAHPATMLMVMEKTPPG